ncbi:MAG: RNA 3'-terminal phosphate cyclase [Fimbriimonadaceae bacterium]
MRTTEDPILLNGSHGEGGGALFRTALCMSALTQKPLVIDLIRGATRKPGISAEDFPVLQALTQCCNATVDGAEIGSKKLHFTPKHLPRPIHFQHDISRSGAGRSRGNTLVVAETLAPILARSGALSSLELYGETHNNNTLTFDAFELCTIPAHHSQGIGIFPSIHQAGFGYAGRGHIQVEIEPSAINSLDWAKRGSVVAAGARVTTCDVHSQIASDAVSRSLKLLQDAGYGDQVDQIELSGPEPGASITFWIMFEHGFGSATACWNRGSQINDTLDIAWKEFTDFTQTTATVDPFLADQLLLPACLADGPTTYTISNITRRLKTIAWVIKEFIPIAITIKGTEGASGTVTIQR